MSADQLVSVITGIKQAVLHEKKCDRSVQQIIHSIKQAYLKEQGKLQIPEADNLRPNLREIIDSIKSARLYDESRTASLPEIISAIKKSFEAHWITDYLPYAQELAAALSKGIPTPVLTVCGKGTREIRFTRYLSYFMNPNNRHGLGSQFLKAMLKKETKNLPKDWPENSQVSSEFWIGSYISKSGREYDCFCDIGIIGMDFAVIIEQKILSSEDTGFNSKGLRQLERYDYALAHNPQYHNKKLIKIYLTPTGKAAAKAANWQPMAHEEIIIRTLELISDQSLPVTARENLRRLLVDLATGPYQAEENNIAELVEVIKHLSVNGFDLPNFLKYRRLTEKNQLLLRVIKEET